jgi:aconitase B
MTGLKISISLTNMEAELCMKFCWLRVTKEAVRQIETLNESVQSMDDRTAQNLEDLETMGPIIEAIRTKIAEALRQEGHVRLNPI